MEGEEDGVGEEWGFCVDLKTKGRNENGESIAEHWSHEERCYYELDDRALEIATN